MLWNLFIIFGKLSNSGLKGIGVNASWSWNWK